MDINKIISILGDEYGLEDVSEEKHHEKVAQKIVALYTKPEKAEELLLTDEERYNLLQCEAEKRGFILISSIPLADRDEMLLEAQLAKLSPLLASKDREIE